MVSLTLCGIPKPGTHTHWLGGAAGKLSCPSDSETTGVLQ